MTREKQIYSDEKQKKRTSRCNSGHINSTEKQAVQSKLAVLFCFVFLLIYSDKLMSTG